MIDYETLLADYASGALDEALSVIVASHLTLSPSARQFVCAYEDLGGALLEAHCGQTALSETCLKSVLDQLDAPIQNTSQQEQAEDISGCAHIPAPLKHYLIRTGQTRLRWIPAMRGIKISPVRFPEMSCFLMRAAPGAETPDHTHEGLEMTLVLQGTYSDHTGQHPCGSLIIADQHVGHAPVADPEQGCLCFIALDSPIRFKTLWGRALSLLMRF